jgi:adenylate kinase
MTQRLVILGAPGSGKGTQAIRIAQHLGIPAISTGEIFRDHITRGTELGKLAESYICAGRLVPDEVTNAMIANRLRQKDTAHGFILDGYPRDLNQVQALDKLLEEMGCELDLVVELVAPHKQVIERLLKRAEIEGRADDIHDVIQERMRVYEKKTAPISTEYRDRGIHMAVDAVGEIDEVSGRVLECLQLARR